MAPADLLNTLVADVLRRVPSTAHVFLEHGMSCVGCPFARFETVTDVAVVYRIDPDALAASLSQAGVESSD